MINDNYINFYTQDLIDFVSKINPTDEIRFVKWQLKVPRSDSESSFSDLIKRHFGEKNDFKK